MSLSCLTFVSFTETSVSWKWVGKGKVKSLSRSKLLDNFLVPLKWETRRSLKVMLDADGVHTSITKSECHTKNSSQNQLPLLEKFIGGNFYHLRKQTKRGFRAFFYSITFPLASPPWAETHSIEKKPRTQLNRTNFTLTLLTKLSWDKKNNFVKIVKNQKNELRVPRKILLFFLSF